jgi:Toprim domain
MSLDLAQLRKLTGGKVGTFDVACPLCGPERHANVNKQRRVLRVWDDGAFVTYCCARCGASGYAHDRAAVASTVPQKPQATTPERDRSDLARYLWAASQAAAGTLVETYLRSRQCWIESPALRFLPARGDHPPAMIARFGGVGFTGVHLTKLRPDGTGKAGTDKDKIMIGPSAGKPIVVATNRERCEVIVAEGIEDAASLALVTGWSAWAAGAAGRIPAMVGALSEGRKLYLAVDNDAAGGEALRKARATRPDLVALRFARTLACRAAIDANKALLQFGAEAVLASIEWCEAQSDYANGAIGFHAMQRAVARADGVFRSLSGDPL